MATFNELMQKMVNTDYEDLVSLAQEAANRLMPHCKAVDIEYDGFFMLTALILSAIGADGVQVVGRVIVLYRENPDIRAYAERI